MGDDEQLYSYTRATSEAEKTHNAIQDFHSKISAGKPIDAKRPFKYPGAEWDRVQSIKISKIDPQRIPTSHEAEHKVETQASALDATTETVTLPYEHPRVYPQKRQI